MARQRPQAWRDGIEVVAMDGFSGFKTATTEELPDACILRLVRAGVPLVSEPVFR